MATLGAGPYYGITDAVFETKAKLDWFVVLFVVTHPVSFLNLIVAGVFLVFYYMLDARFEMSISSIMMLILGSGLATAIFDIPRSFKVFPNGSIGIVTLTSGYYFGDVLSAAPFIPSTNYMFSSAHF